MSKGRDQRGSAGDQINPPRFPDTPPPIVPSGDYSYTLEIVMNMQLSLGKLTEAVEGLKAKQSDQTKKLDRLSHQVYAGIAILVAIGAVLTFFAKGINDVIVHQLLNPPPQQQVSPASPPPQASPVPQQPASQQPSGPAVRRSRRRGRPKAP